MFSSFGPIPTIGLTGTLMQNDHKELHSLVTLISPDSFGEWSMFQEDYVVHIKAARQKTAARSVVERGEKRSKALRDILNKFYLSRRKEDCLSHALKEKSESVIFVHLSQVRVRRMIAFILFVVCHRHDNSNSSLRSLPASEGLVPACSHPTRVQVPHRGRHALRLRRERRYPRTVHQNLAQE